MPTVVRVGSLRVAIYPDDHDPPHVHVIGNGETKIELGSGPQDVTVVFSADTKASEKRKALEAVREHHALLIDRWKQLHERYQR